MGQDPKKNAEDTAELQRLYSELPWAIAEAAKATQGEQPSDQGTTEPLEGDEKVDTIIRRICQLSDELEGHGD